MFKCIAVVLLFSLTARAHAEWVPADPINNPDPIPTPYPGPSPLHWEVNQLRRANNVIEIVGRGELDCAAYRHAKDLHENRRCSHTGSNGSRLSDRAKDCGTFASTELIACGYSEAQAVLDAWQRKHQSILLDPTKVALGAARVGNVWVLIFQ